MAIKAYLHKESQPIAKLRSGSHVTANARDIQNIVIDYGDAPLYTGATVVTPTEETQVLFTSNHTVMSDITIEPIPTNYGRITVSGNIITVS